MRDMILLHLYKPAFVNILNTGAALILLRALPQFCLINFLSLFSPSSFCCSSSMNFSLGF